MARVPVRVPLEVVLVLGLGLPERAGRRHLGDHLARPKAGRVDVGDRVLGDLLLLVAEVEDGRPVAGPDVVALPVPRGRVVHLEEEVQQVPVGDLVRVEDDLDRLRVAAVVPVGGVRHVAAGIADPGGDHAGELAEGAVTLALQVIERDEAQRRGVDAVAHAARLARAVGEHVAKVAVPVRRPDLRPDHAVALVGVLDHVARLDRHREARPAGVAVVLVDRSEQRLAGHDVHVNAGFLVVPVLVLERRLGTSLLGDLVLLRGQPGNRLGVLAVSVRHVSSFTDGAARWLRARNAPSVEPRAGRRYFTRVYRSGAVGSALRAGAR